MGGRSAGCVSVALRAPVGTSRAHSHQTLSNGVAPTPKSRNSLQFRLGANYARFSTAIDKGPSSYENIMGRTEAEDFGVSLMAYPGGTAVVEAGWVAGDGPMLDIEVLGSRGTLRMRGEHLVVQIGDGGDDTDLGAIELDAGMGLRPFLRGISSGDWSECVCIGEAVDANLVALQWFPAATNWPTVPKEHQGS